MYFSSRRLQRRFSSMRELTRTWGQPIAKKIAQRVTELEPAANLEELRSLPAARCHQLTGDRKGDFAVSLDGQMRLVFRPQDNPVPQLPNGGTDWAAIDSVIIVEVVDYH